jgi:hypothetical protein
LEKKDDLYIENDLNDDKEDFNNNNTFPEKNEDYDTKMIMDWPVDAYSTLYVDGNNMLFLNNILRKNTLGRKKKEK